MEHYSAYLMHHLMKVPEVKYIRDFGTPFGHCYVIEFRGVTHTFFGIPLPKDKRVNFNVEVEEETFTIDNLLKNGGFHYDSEKK